ncbi:45367_t:CDS:2, partial [Gigaspora margarita]
TQVMTVQVTEKNKEGACPHTNKKRKAEESEEREKNRKMLKHKKETSLNILVEVNKANKNILLQQTEQTEMDFHTQLAEALVIDNKDTSKHDDSDNLKDITNATNSWVTPSTSSTSTNEKIKNVHEPNLYSDHKHEDMQTDAVLCEIQTKSNEVAINKKNIYDEKENTHYENVGTPTTSSTCPDEEMVSEPSNPLRDELLDLYGMADNKKNLPPVTVENNTSVEDLQPSMLSQ